MIELTDSQKAVLDLLAKSLYGYIPASDAISDALNKTKRSAFSDKEKSSILKAASEQAVLLLVAGELTKMGYDLGAYQKTI